MLGVRLAVLAAAGQPSRRPAARFGNVPSGVGSIYEQIGGTAAVAATVDERYARVVGDRHLARYFDGIDMATAHAGLGITGADFGRVTSHLAGALAGVGIAPDTLHDIIARLAPLRDDIVAA
ncbi:MAG: hemoglobin [Solirubrobacteraceae bacterium]|nr:hemoglobin [Solirubrobacteraceae bacterium]